jgi:hypothetical protein
VDVAGSAFKAEVTQQALEPTGEGLAVPHDRPASTMPLVDQARELEQIGLDRVELRPRRDHEVDHRELGRRGVTAAR